MVEFCFGDFMEIFRRMTSCALLFEFSLMRIFVAGTAGSEFHANVPDCLSVIERRSMTALTLHYRMLACKRIV